MTTTTTRDLADQLADEYGIDRLAASSGVETYVGLLDVDDYDAVTETLSPNGVEIIRAQFAAYYAENSDVQAANLLEDIREATNAGRTLQDQADDKVRERDALIQRAVAYGIRVADIADAADLKPARVYQIRDGRR